MWTQDKRSRSSTQRELSTIEFSLLSCLPILCTSHVKWCTGNQATVKIVEVGSIELKLHTFALEIKICYEHSIHSEIDWVPWDHNVTADLISKLVNFDDRQVTEDVFKDLDGLCGPHTVDCHVLMSRSCVDNHLNSAVSCSSPFRHSIIEHCADTQ